MKNLGVFLAIGESLTDFKKKGQLARLLDYNIKYYLQSFDTVYIFSYGKENIKLPENVVLVQNRLSLHRYLYCLLLPFIQFRFVSKCGVIRALQLSGGIPAIIAKIFFGRPYVVNYGYDYSGFAIIEGKYLQSLIYRVIKYPILFFADSVILTSKEFTLGFTNLKKIALIPNGVDLSLFKRIYNASQKTEKNIVFLGRLETQKNLEELILACSSLSYKYVLNFYGDGTKKDELRIAANKVGVNLKIHQPVKYIDVPKLLSGADIFVLVSKKEGNPKVLIEAAASGCVIVASKVDGNKEILNDGDTALLCNTDHKSIRIGLERAIIPHLRKKLSMKARSLAEKEFDIAYLLKKETDLLLKFLR